jgi:hypothetical protein
LRKALTPAIATLIIVIVLAAGFIVTNTGTQTKNPDAYVGVTYCGDTVEDGKALINKVKGYTNLFVLNSGLLQRDFESVNELGDYAVKAGMYFLSYFGTYVQATFEPWLEDAKQRWGDHFLGVYYGDEPAGKMLDDYVEYSDPATGDTITKHATATCSLSSRTARRSSTKSKAQYTYTRPQTATNQTTRQSFTLTAQETSSTPLPAASNTTATSNSKQSSHSKPSRKLTRGISTATKPT